MTSRAAIGLTIGGAVLALAALLAFLWSVMQEPPPPVVEAPPEPEVEQPAPEEPAKPQLALTAVDFGDLPGWGADAVSEVIPALRRSCDRLSRLPADRAVGTQAVPAVAADWQAVCAETLAAGGDDAALRAALEKTTRPYLASDRDDADGLFTGYFEADLAASPVPDETYRYPIYRRPGDLVTADLGAFDPELAGKRIVGRVDKDRFVPYPDRERLETGHLDGQGLELFWARDAIDVFLLQVQGSGRVTLPDGGSVRIGFDGHNGRPYISIGRALIDRGALEPHEASWDGIRGWMERNPVDARDLLYVNPRYVFFRVLDGDGPIGAEGVALTPGRSLAVDRAFLPMGLPVWLDTTWPLEPDRPLRRLMMAQDTGGAIKGPVRGDFFWGYGDEALKYAGRMKSRGSYYLLLPLPVAERLNKGA